VHFFVDGYNFLFKLSHDWHFDLRTQREALIRAFNEKIEELKLSLTIVFDGAEMPKGDYTRGHWRSVEVVYTHEGLSADEYILRQLEEVKHGKLYTVVTADRELMNRAKMLGAHAMDNKTFLQLLEKRKQKRRRRGPQRSVMETKENIARLEKIFQERLRKPEDE
jgi:predicted RNA-binding protein with PIN domain